jgi:hypothetical protein
MARFGRRRHCQALFQNTQLSFDGPGRHRPPSFTCGLRCRSMHYQRIRHQAKINGTWDVRNYHQRLGIVTDPPALSRRALRSGFHTFRCVFLFAPIAPAVQVFIPTMRAFDRSQLEFRQRFAARCCSRNRYDSPARSVLTQPSCVDLARYHLLGRPDIDVAQRR